jgi:hypothetical protein
MEQKMDIETITNALLVIQRMRQLQNPVRADENGQPVEIPQPDRLTLLQDTLTSISDIFPAVRGGSFGEAFRLSSHYSSTYRGIKHHFREMGKSGGAGGAGSMGIGQLLQTLKVIAPAFNSRQKVYMDKVIKIFDILVS